jgi:hypothetical protein
VKIIFRSHDYSVNSDDLYKCAIHIAQSALELKNSSFVTKYAAEAESRDYGKNMVNTMIVKAVDG